jgi:hypothetical protein
MSSTSGPDRAAPRDGRDPGPSSSQVPAEGPPDARGRLPTADGPGAGPFAVLLILGILFVGLIAMAAVAGGPHLDGHGAFVHHRWAVAGPDRFPSHDVDQNPGTSGSPGLVAGVMLGGVALAGGGAAAVAYRRRRRSTAEWIATLSARFDAVREEYGGYQSDLLAVLDRPALADSSVPQTAAFITAYGVAQDTERVVRRTRSAQTVATFEAAVRNLETAWRIAREYAARAGTDAIPASERSKVTRAVDALRLALADGGNPAERQAGYRLAIRLIEQVVNVPWCAIAAVESDQRLARTVGRTASHETSASHGMRRFLFRPRNFELVYDHDPEEVKFSGGRSSSPVNGSRSSQATGPRSACEVVPPLE